MLTITADEAEWSHLNSGQTRRAGTPKRVSMVSANLLVNIVVKGQPRRMQRRRAEKAAPELDAEIPHYFPFADPVPPGIQQWVPRTLAEDYGLVERQDAGENRGLDKATAGRLRPLLEDARRATGLAGAVVALSDALKADEGKLLGASKVLNNLRRVRRILRGLDLGSLPPDQLAEIRAQLAALQQQVGATEANARSAVSPTDAEVAAARRAFPAWAETAPEERIALVERLLAI